MARKKKARKKSSRKARKRTLLRRIPFGRLILLFLLLMGVYVVYLDVTVRHHFEGKRWALPARVYSQPLELYSGARLKQATLTAYLKRLAYRKDSRLKRSGSYLVDGQKLHVLTREFQYWDGLQKPRHITVSFDDGSISWLRDNNTQQEISLLRMEPLIVGSFYPSHNEDRVLVKHGDLPPYLIRALLVTEDRDFYNHVGISPKGIARALLANIRAGATVQGGSTLTQQLVKNFYLSDKRSLWRKANEAIMALLLEFHYEKNEILEAYLNEVYLGQDGNRAIHGFGLASQFYFDKKAADLNLTESVLLVALVKGASYYNPRKHPQRAKKRRDLLLDAMFEQKVINKKQAAIAKRQPLGVVRNPPGSIASYPAFMDLVRNQLKRDYREEDLTSEGLRIFSTMDSFIQDRVNIRFKSGLKTLEKQRNMKSGSLNGAVVVSDPATGEVLAVNGDRNERASGFNRALFALRPVGSLIKPAVYLTALSQPETYTVITGLDDSPIEIKNHDGSYWRPKNFDKQNRKIVPLYDALVQSYNIPTVRLGMELGLPRVIDSLRKLGIRRDMHGYPSLLLGAEEFSPIEMTQMYQTLASGGFYSPLRSIRDVTDASGAPLQRYPLDVEQVFKPGPVYMVNTLLHQVTQSGTARSLVYQLPGVSVAGKTGTTDDLRDSWFAGFSANRLAIVWVGRDDNKPTGLTGSSGAMRIWSGVMSDIQPQSLTLVKPDEVEWVWVDHQSALRGSELCSDAAQYPFIKGSGPTEYAPCAGGAVREALDKVLDWFR